MTDGIDSETDERTETDEERQQSGITPSDGGHESGVTPADEDENESGVTPADEDENEDDESGGTRDAADSEA